MLLFLGCRVVGFRGGKKKEDEVSESLFTHMYGLYDCHAMRSAVPPHVCEFEMRVNAAIG